MGNSGMLNRIKSFLRKSKGDNLQVLGRYNPTNKVAGNAFNRHDSDTLDVNDDLDDGDLPSKTSAETASYRDKGAIYRANDTQMGNQSDESEIEDEELPSVNKRASKGKFPPVASLIGLGLFAFFAYSLFSSTRPAPLITTAIPNAVVPASTGPEQMMNQMPPLVMPPQPAPLVAPIGNPATSIPLQSTAPSVPVVVQDPDWVTRKINSEVLHDVKGKDNSSPSTGTQLDAKETKVLKAAIDAEGPQGELSQNLKSLVEAKGVSASILPNRNFMIAKGTLLDCALETAIDSSLAGLITCRLTRDVYSDNGRVIMLDRGSQLVGEYKSGIAEGMIRIFVLWTRAKTPKGVVINLNSPGTDALGRSGLEGFVDTHFFERFGTAIMMSLVQESFDYAKAKAQSANVNGSNSTVSTTNAGGSSILDRMATEQMKKSMTIPPVLYINQGANVQVMVVRDLDFSTVYGIEEKE